MSAAALRRAERGLTLMELVVALGVSAIAIATAMTLLVQQQRAYGVSAGDRGQQEAGRGALREIVGRLRLAGYGVDPNLAFDFGQTDVVPRTNLVAPLAAVQQSSYLCPAGQEVRCRDRADGPDEVVFLSRNPAFSRVASAVSSTQLTLVGELTRPILRGQILQVSCLGGSQTRAYVTASQVVSAPSSPNPAGTVVVPLEPGQVASGRPVFPFENGQLADSCFGLTGGQAPVVTQVDRHRFYVVWLDEQGTEYAPQSDAARPYLMLDRGLVDDTGQPVLVPVASDVEDLQLTWYFPPAAAGGPRRAVGADPGVNAADEAFPITTQVVPPGYLDAPDAAARTTGHPANLEAVRVSVVVRSPDADIALTGAAAAVPAAGNRPALAGALHHRRALFETTVVIRNMRTTTFAYPMRDPAGTPGANLGGG